MKTLWSWIKSFFSGPRHYHKFRDYPIFSKLTSYDLYLLNERMHERNFEAGEYIFQAGYPVEVIYLVESGEIKLEGEHRHNRGKILKTGAHLGLLDLYHDGKRNSTAIANTKVKLRAISRTDFLDFLQARPRCGLKILTAVCKNLTDLIFEQDAEN